MDTRFDKRISKLIFSHYIKPWLRRLVIISVFILGLGIRLYDLTDPPFDFHPTRQLRAAIISRGLYYRLVPNVDSEKLELATSMANSMGRFEPPITEGLVSLTYYLVGGEHLWIGRIYASIFWLVGGIFLYLLARRTASTGGAVVALAFYLFLPFGIFASRSFQPDPFMVMWIILSAWCFCRWAETGSWNWAIAAGLIAGMAVLTKAVAGYLVVGMAVSVVLSVLGLRRSFKLPQVWVMAGLMSIPAFIYYGFFLQGRSSDYFINWSVALFPMLTNPSFYMRWLNHLHSLMGLETVFLGLLGLSISPPLARWVLLGLWVGYGIYGISLPHQIITHNYYSEVLIPIVALSLVPITTTFLSKLTEQKRFWQALLAIIALVAIAYPLWTARAILIGQDYHSEPLFWQEVGETIPEQGRIIALTQDYGYPLMYYGWRKASLWPSQAEQSLAVKRGSVSKDFQEEFLERTEGMSYFLVTTFDQFNKKTELKEYLENNYPIYSQGVGYLIYDLTHPIDVMP